MLFGAFVHFISGIQSPKAKKICMMYVVDMRKACPAFSLILCANFSRFVLFGFGVHLTASFAFRYCYVVDTSI